jgi:hypothetical protein
MTFRSKGFPFVTLVVVVVVIVVICMVMGVEFIFDIAGLCSLW